jgi:hypothetical protein
VLARVTDTVGTAEEAESELAELFRSLEGA